MKAGLLCVVLFATALNVSVQSAPHEQHESLSTRSQSSEIKDRKLNADHDYILPTFFFEEPDPERLNKDASKKTRNGRHGPDSVMSAVADADDDGKSIPVLVNEEMLAQLIKESEHESEQDEENLDGDDLGHDSDPNEERAELTAEDGEEKYKEKSAEEEVGSSTDLEIPLDLDYAPDSVSTETRNTKMEGKNPLAIKEEEKVGGELPTVMEYYDTQSTQDYEDVNDGHHEEISDGAKSAESPQDEQILLDPETEQSDADEDNDRRTGEEGKEFPEGVDTNESVSRAKGKGKILKKMKRLSEAQSDQPSSAEISDQRPPNPEPEQEAEITHTLIQRKKWASLLGTNPGQIRAAVDLMARTTPTARPKSRTGSDPGQEASRDSCENFHCKRGKTCQINDKKKPSCVCQDPADCLPSLNQFDHVCGTDNQTYDSSCQLFATKCNLEGSQKGHRLHLDYTGSCKFIPPCLKTELIHFPLRMRDWLKNVLLQLYDHDFLTDKQRARVQKVYENERRLHEGDHPIELLTRDFEKNYNMYIYPVHWKFAQMDQHPTDRFLSHSELAPLRAPLVPMEHCTSAFFRGCDADKDKLISFQEWCQCFGIKYEDMDTDLLF